MHAGSLALNTAAAAASSSVTCGLEAIPALEATSLVCSRAAHSRRHRPRLPRWCRWAAIFGTRARQRPTEGWVTVVLAIGVAWPGDWVGGRGCDGGRKGVGMGANVGGACVEGKILATLERNLYHLAPPMSVIINLKLRWQPRRPPLLAGPAPPRYSLSVD